MAKFDLKKHDERMREIITVSSAPQGSLIQRLRARKPKLPKLPELPRL